MVARKRKTAARLSSMTGFSRASGRDARHEWVWELKCVNGRGLDVRCRLPAGLDMLETAARAAATARFSRGNLTMTLRATPVDVGASVKVDRQLLERLLDVAREYRDAPGVLPPRLDGLLSIRGVIEPVEEAATGEEMSARVEAMVETLETALDELRAARLAEGDRLKEILRGHVAEIEELATKVVGYVAALPESLSARLNERLSGILDARPGLPEDRLAQELAALLVKSDVKEEMDRLAAHVEAVGELLAEGGAVGRRLDFLAQELNREASTLCAKAVDVSLARVGLDLKAVIDRFREQVQNLE